MENANGEPSNNNNNNERLAIMELAKSQRSAVGTPDYLAPEILLGTEHGSAADWWSVGIVLFELITGIPPFNSEHPEGIFDNILNKQIPWPSVPEEMSFEARDLIDRLLVHDPNKRLGAKGASEVKEHQFFRGVDWDNLALQKAAFVPQTDGVDDTSYFISRYGPSGVHDDEDCNITGGLPPIGEGCTADSVYKAGFEQLVCQNEKYYKRFPQDIEIVRDVVNYLAESGGGVPLPSGGILTPRGLQLLGLSGLGSSTGFERLHYLFERVWDPLIVQGAKRRISDYFLNAYERWIGFDANPLYALLHESIYCQGASSLWSAHRIRALNDNKFDAIEAAKVGRPVLFTGEMIFPWIFDEVHALRPFKDAAQLLAEKNDWPSLYDIAALKDNKVPVAAAVYYEDMYVNLKLSMETASRIAGIRPWITNEYMHSGLRDAGSRVLDHLLAMLNGKKPLF